MPVAMVPTAKDGNQCHFHLLGWILADVFYVKFNNGAQTIHLSCYNENWFSISGCGSSLKTSVVQRSASVPDEKFSDRTPPTSKKRPISERLGSNVNNVSSYAHHSNLKRADMEHSTIKP
eukprot:Gb_16842 [translate_table: standard]